LLGGILGQSGPSANCGDGAGQRPLIGRMETYRASDNGQRGNFTGNGDFSGQRGNFTGNGDFSDQGNVLNLDQGQTVSGQGGQVFRCNCPGEGTIQTGIIPVRTNIPVTSPRFGEINVTHPGSQPVFARPIRPIIPEASQPVFVLPPRPIFAPPRAPQPVFVPPPRPIFIPPPPPPQPVSPQPFVLAGVPGSVGFPGINLSGVGSGGITSGFGGSFGFGFGVIGVI